jgi:hypothetical protein
VGGVSERPLVGSELGTISGEDAEAPSMNGLVLLPDVFDDVAHAAQWYDEEGCQGLGDRFVACFYAYLLQIERRGEIHRKVYKDFRRVLLKPFPYALYHRHHSRQIVVALVIHTARKPSFVRRLLRERGSKKPTE